MYIYIYIRARRGWSQFRLPHQGQWPLAEAQWLRKWVAREVRTLRCLETRCAVGCYDPIPLTWYYHRLSMIINMIIIIFEYYPFLSLTWCYPFLTWYYSVVIYLILESWPLDPVIKDGNTANDRRHCMKHIGLWSTWWSTQMLCLLTLVADTVDCSINLCHISLVESDKFINALKWRCWCQWRAFIIDMRGQIESTNTLRWEGLLCIKHFRF